MIKELQTKIIKLEQTIQAQIQDFQKKKQNYQNVIFTLQTQNQKLKDQIGQSNQSVKLRNSYSRYSDRSKVKPENDQLSGYQFKEVQNQSFYNDVEEVIKQNNYLKQEIATISITYQRQMDQLTQYFQKIKSSSRISQSSLKDASKSSRVSGKISLLMNAYETMLKNYDSQKTKFTQKIQELAKYLVWSQQKNKQLNQQKRQIQTSLKLSQQKLSILRKSLHI